MFYRNTDQHTALHIVPRLATFLFNYIQLGLVIDVAGSIADYKIAVVLLVFFEIGILADCFFRGGAIRIWTWLACLSAIALLVSQLFLSSNTAVSLSMISVAVLAMSLKKIRSSTDALGNIKRTWRALGYLSAGLFSIWVVVGLAIFLFAVVFISRVSERTDAPLPEKFRVDTPRLGPYLVVMLHHLHYFGYAYMLIFIFHSRIDVPRAALGPIFYIGWLGYYLFMDATRHQKPLVIWGHVLAALSVFGMLVTESATTLLVLWFLTGVGGGTIILLREAKIRDDAAVYERFKTWEAFGHVLGLTTLAITVLLEQPTLSFLIAGIAGLLCAVGAAVWTGRDKTTLVSPTK
jgi:hypothetical protein